MDEEKLKENKSADVSPESNSSGASSLQPPKKQTPPPPPPPPKPGVPPKPPKPPRPLKANAAPQGKNKNVESKNAVEKPVATPEAEVPKTSLKKLSSQMKTANSLLKRKLRLHVFSVKMTTMLQLQ